MKFFRILPLNSKSYAKIERHKMNCSIGGGGGDYNQNTFHSKCLVFTKQATWSVTSCKSYFVITSAIFIHFCAGRHTEKIVFAHLTASFCMTYLGFSHNVNHKIVWFSITFWGTWSLAGKFCSIITWAYSSITELFITAIFTVLFSITMPVLRNTVSIRVALKFFPIAPSKWSCFYEKQSK